MDDHPGRRGASRTTLPRLTKRRATNLIDIGAGYSTLREEELLTRLLPAYRLRNPETCRFWERGVNDTYRVDCADRTCFLRVYRHGLRTRDEIEFEIAALNHLSARGAAVAAPIARHDGGFVSGIHAPEGLRHAILTSEAPGTEPTYRDADEARLFGASVAELHRLSEGFVTGHERPRLEVGYLLDTSLDTVRPFLAAHPERRAFVDESAAMLRRAVADGSPDALDRGLCHGDCHGSNVHLHDGTMTHFDFDCCGFGLRVFELATFKWGAFREDNGDALWTRFLDGYRSRHKVGAADLALVDVFVVIRHLWWMGLIMGNARDFGHGEVDEAFIDRNLGWVRKLMERATSGDTG